MAVVRISKQLTEEVTNAARLSMKASYERAAKSMPDYSQFVYDTIFGEYQTKIAQLPAGFFRKTKSMTVRFTGLWGCDRMPMHYPADMVFPLYMFENDKAKRVSSYEDSYELTSDPVWDEFKAEVAAYSKRLLDASNTQKELIDGVAKLLSSYSTLAPALKQWPPLWDLLPEGTKRKHKEIVERAVPAAVDASGVDLNRMTVIASISKMGG